MHDLLPILAAITAILAVIVGPLISLRISRQRAQLEAVVLVRVETMKQMRLLYAEFIAHLMVANNERGMGRIGGPELTAKLERAFRLETELSLMLNAENQHERELIENMCSARNRVFKPADQEFDPLSWQPHYEAATIALVRVLNRHQQEVTKLR